MARSISIIAREIKDDWKNVPACAMAYLGPMHHLNKIDGMYYADTASSVVAYFLSNASGWRGETARRVKKELNDMLKEHRNGR